ncbi:HNH endonuclease [Streptomyces sp. NPDC002276]
MRPSRWTWQAHHGPIPDRHVIRHACDRSWCTRPACLQLGDQGDNLADALRRDRLTHPGRVGKADRRGAAEAARAVRAAVLDAVGRNIYDPFQLGEIVAGALAEGDPFADHGRLF